MCNIHGFRLLREQAIPELDSRARQYGHAKTGTQLLSLENADENKVFGITFRTLPSDETGVPHILEHAVLGGSRRYPVKQPFVELIKGSLTTFVNAITFSDMTCFPVASQNVQDFYNLIDVYLDAVFYPRISRDTLAREGWHYELDATSDPLAYNGIVFSEMKGAYSSVDSILSTEALRSIFPENVYGLDSGGHPHHIPELTYERFKAFYAAHYHPSNALVFFGGDDPPEERLRMLDAWLSEFEPAAQAAPAALQPPFAAPRTVTVPYPVGEEAPSTKAHVVLSWILGEGTDPLRNLEFELLTEILLGSPASPLRRALLDSELGEEIPTPFDWFLGRQVPFAAGLKGVAPAQAERVGPLILRTLGRLASDGIDPATVEAATNTVEFRLRENNPGSLPRGLFLMFRALGTWLHDGDPIARLAFAGPLQTINQALAENPRLFEELIRTHLIANPHRATLYLQPDPGMRQREDAEEKRHLETARAAMSPADLDALILDTRRLRELQSMPDSPEALATIPVLKRTDLEKRHRPIPITLEAEGGTPVIHHDLSTNGLVYLDLGFDLRVLPAADLPYVPFLGRALLEMGTDREDHVRFSQRIGRATGGITPETLTSVMKGSPDDPIAWLFLRGKATAAKVEELLVILRDGTLTAKLDNQDRFRRIVSEDKSRREAQLIQNGRAVIDWRLRSHFSMADWAHEQMNNLDGLFFTRKLAQDIETGWPLVLARLEAVRARLLNRAAMLVNVTTDAETWGKMRPQVSRLLANLPTDSVAFPSWTRPAARRREGFTIPAAVNYVGKAADLFALGYALHGSVDVIRNHLGWTWLWDKIRLRGGAYGAYALFDRLSGIFRYISYRDPNLLTTLDAYDGTSGFLRALDLTDSELSKAIIGAIGTLDAHQLPDAKGFTSLTRYLTGETDASLQQIRDEVLSTTPRHFKAFAEVLEHVSRSGDVVVLAPDQALQQAKQERDLGEMQVQQAL